MQDKALFSIAIILLSACANVETEPFDPASDPRIGKEVRQACFSRNSGLRGGFRTVGDRTGFITGTLQQQYLLTFSAGCSNLRPQGSFPIFRTVGNNCRRQGEVVTVAQGGGVSGICTIDQIFEWNEDAPENEGFDEDTSNPEIEGRDRGPGD